MSSPHPANASAATEHGIIVSAHTEYPSVAGNPAFSGTSMKAPHTPQNSVVMSANSSQGGPAHATIRSLPSSRAAFAL